MVLGVRPGETHAPLTVQRPPDPSPPLPLGQGASTVAGGCTGRSKGSREAVDVEDGVVEGSPDATLGVGDVQCRPGTEETVALPEVAAGPLSEECRGVVAPVWDRWVRYVCGG